MPAKIIAYLGLGSNLYHPLEQIKQAINELSQLKNSKIIAQSSFYESNPVGPQDQPKFINAVIKLETELLPLELLTACQAIEHKQGRVKTRHWGERCIDIDILLFGKQRIALPELKVPHPEMHKRAFVLQPLFEIEPSFIEAFDPVYDGSLTLIQ
jgi:2-amino-4-hydroxy-6-hydroxymethyldihydropteridine diphosphokinase